jgi:hypothetical protein
LVAALGRVIILSVVAQTAQITRPLVTPPAAFVEGRWRVHPFTRTDAEALVRLGMIPEDASTELLNGMVVLTDRSSLEQDPTMIGQGHTICVERLSDLRSRISSAVRHVRTQQPLVCSETHVPQPDFMVLRGVLADYSDLPKAADAWCVVEVADSSYERDLGIKLRGYALAGVGQNIIINLRNRTAEVYAIPDPTAGSYATPRVIEESGTLSLRVGENESFDVALRDLLP